jgi:hypothetical protein
MDCLKLLVIFIISAAAVTGFHPRSSLGKFKILPLGALLELFPNQKSKVRQSALLHSALQNLL